MLAPLRAGPFAPPFQNLALRFQLTLDSPCSTPPKSPIILDDGASHDEDATPTSLQDESAAAAAAAFDKLAPRRKRSLSADSHDRASAAAVVQVDPIGAAVQLPDREPRAISLAPPPPSSETPWKSVALQSPPLPIPFVAVTSPPLTVPAPPQHQHQHQHRSAYPISSAAGFVQEAPAVYQSPYSFVSYDLSPGFLPLPPPSTTTTTSTALPPVVAPFSSAPSGLPEQHPETFSPPFPVPPTTLYYPIPGEPNHLLPPSAGYSLPPASHAVETYLPSPPLSPRCGAPPSGSWSTSPRSRPGSWSDRAAHHALASDDACSSSAFATSPRRQRVHLPHLVLLLCGSFPACALRSRSPSTSCSSDRSLEQRRLGVFWRRHEYNQALRGQSDDKNE